jgi:hypothetical protein
MHVFTINRLKSESPLIATFFIFSIFVSLFLFPKILWFSFLVFPLMAIAYLILRKLKLGLFKKECFLILDDEGIRYCYHLFQQAKFLRWDQIEKVNYQMYEVNFKLKESGAVISMQTSYLKEQSEVEEFKSIINQNCEMT